MHAPRNSLSILSLAAASACLMIAGIGCKSESEKADAQVHAAIADGDTKAKSPEDLAAAAEKAVGFKNASPEAQIGAHLKLAAAKAAQAGELMVEIDRNNNRIGQLTGEISRAVDVIQKNNSMQLAFKKSEPKAAEAAVQKAKDAALGKTDPVWFKHESGPVPAMAGVDKSIADTQGQIQAVQAEITKLTDERTKAIADAERLSKDAEAAANRKASLDLFTKAEAQRDLSRQNAAKVLQQQGKLKMLQEDLDREQAEKKVLTTAVASLDAQLKETRAGWTATEADIKSLHDLTLALLGNGSASAPAGATDSDAPAKAPTDATTPDAATEPAAPADPAAPPAEEKKDDDAAKPAARVPAHVGNVRLVSSDVILVQLPPTRGATPAPGAGRTPPKKGTTPNSAKTRTGDAPSGAGPSEKVVIAPFSLDVSAKGAELTALVADIGPKRDKALELLTSAADHYKTAATLADGLSRKFAGMQSKIDREKPERMIWGNVLEAYNPSSFGLQQASVQLMIARLHQSTAEELAMRGRMLTMLQAALKEAGATAPGALATAPLDLNTQAGTEREAAEKAYVVADEAIGTVEKATGSNPALTQASKLSRLLKIASYYGQGQLKGQTEPDKVEGFITQAVNEAKSGGGGGSDPLGGGGGGGSIALPIIVQDALGLRKTGGGDLTGAGSTTTSGPSSNPSTDATTEPTTGPADPSKVFEKPEEGTGGDTKPATPAATKPATGDAPADPAAPPETPAEPDSK